MSIESGTEHDKAFAFKVLISTVLSLMVMIADFIWLIRDESGIIWPKFRSSRYAKLYVFSRYLGLASQIFNVSFTTRMYAGVPSTPSVCRMWYGFQAIVVQLLLASVEVTLMHRIYALFFKNQYILLVLVLFGVSQVASMAVSARFAVPSGRHTATCMVTRPHPGNAYFGATTMTINIIIFFMTFWKYLRLPMKWTHGNIGWVILRDSALTLLAISIVMFFMTLCALEVITPRMSGVITYYWLVCILCVSSTPQIGRIIINHEKIPQDSDVDVEGSTWGGAITSWIDIPEIILSHRITSELTHAHLSPTATDSRGTLPGVVGTAGRKAGRVPASICLGVSHVTSSL
ncbi:hypothetical protein BS17DRAFT_810566 [Gyrodon lividus]|nr:hypothetical protein BS17DRAFT_810566 [Gyrodon lividus]